MAARVPLAQPVDEGQQEAQRDEAARRQDRQRDRPRIDALDKECEDYMLQVSDWEIRNYLDRM